MKTNIPTGSLGSAQPPGASGQQGKTPVSHAGGAGSVTREAHQNTMTAGKSGRNYRGAGRTGQQRLDAILPAIERGKEFQERVSQAAGDAVRCADLMAEAIAMDREQRGLEVAGRDGRIVLTMEALQAMYCMDAAREAYLKARGSNLPPLPQPPEEMR
jgi:hypothetical protein